VDQVDEFPGVEEAARSWRARLAPHHEHAVDPTLQVQPWPEAEGAWTADLHRPAIGGLARTDITATPPSILASTSTKPAGMKVDGCSDRAMG